MPRGSNLFDLSYGGWSNETTIMGTDRNPRPFKNVIDNAIEDGKIQPLIIVLPTDNNTSREDKLKSKSVTDTIQTLRELISDELDFEEGISDGVADAILDRIEVEKTDRRNVVRLKVYLKVMDGYKSFLIKRKRGSEIFVCAEPYI